MPTEFCGDVLDLVLFKLQIYKGAVTSAIAKETAQAATTTSAVLPQSIVLEQLKGAAFYSRPILQGCLPALMTHKYLECPTC